MRKLNSIKALAMILVAGVFVSVSAFGQGSDLPYDAKPGQCYAKCLVPDEYETVTEQILTKEESTKLSISKAEYRMEEETVMVKEGYTVLEVVPPTYTTVTEEIMVKEASTKLKTVPATYETVTETLMISPATTKWVKGKASTKCLSKDPNDCRVWCLKEIPAQYKTVKRQVVATPATTTEVVIPAEYKTVTKTVVQNPATTRETTVPAEYRTVKRQVLDRPASTSQVVIPAEYKTVTTRRLVSAGGFTEWREVLCESDANPQTIRKIQLALKEKGYDPGPIDNILGAQTRDAIKQFQTDNGLAVGVQGRSIPYETLKALGL